MKRSEKQTLMVLEGKLIYSLSQFNDYDIDLTLEDDDFSKEILFIKTLNDFDRYKRAFLLFDYKLGNLDILEEQVTSKLEDIRSNENQKFDLLTTKYFGENRINNIFNELENNSFKNIGQREILDENIDHFKYVIKLMDNLNLASNSDLSVYHTVKDLFKTGRNDFESIRKKNHFTLQYYSKYVPDIANSLLIENDQLNEWWFQIQPLSASSLDHAFNVFHEKQNQNTFVSEVIVQIGKESLDTINQMKDNLQEAITWGRGNLDKFDALIFNFITDKQTTPSYATWNEENTPISSDHAMASTVLQRVAKLNKEIVEDLIKLARNPELELDHRKRNEIIATAYLMIGKTKEAMDLLDSE